MVRNFRLTALLLGAVLFPVASLGAQPERMHLPPESKAIFGIVVLGKTTLNEFSDAIKEKGCTLENENGTATVKAGCFEVPGNPKVSVLTTTKLRSFPKDAPPLIETNSQPVENGVIECVYMQFEEPSQSQERSPSQEPLQSEETLQSGEPSNWQKYLDSLRYLWGMPSMFHNSGLAGEKWALWRRKGIVIVLSEKTGDPTYLTYSTPARLDRLIAEKKKAENGRGGTSG